MLLKGAFQITRACCATARREDPRDCQNKHSRKHGGDHQVFPPRQRGTSERGQNSWMKALTVGPPKNAVASPCVVLRRWSHSHLFSMSRTMSKPACLLRLEDFFHSESAFDCYTAKSQR